MVVYLNSINEHWWDPYFNITLFLQFDCTHLRCQFDYSEWTTWGPPGFWRTLPLPSLNMYTSVWVETHCSFLKKKKIQTWYAFFSLHPSTFLKSLIFFVALSSLSLSYFNYCYVAKTKYVGNFSLWFKIVERDYC